ncbi:MAG: 3'(2'),5'-bisphosphate nucleotidase CysQ [Albidovulum sp.]
MPESDVELLIEAARAAGEIARRYWRKRPETWDKPGGAGPVTEADLAVNAMLHAELGAARRDYGWLSEESPDDPRRLGRGRSFIIDPIDGTRAFIAGEENFAHSLAVAEAGRIIAAVVYLPVKDALYAATEAGVATLNGRPIQTAGETDPAHATVLTAKSNLAPEHWHEGRPPPFRREFRASLAWRLCLVAEGRFDAMLSLRPTWEWDIAAGDLIARRAGARVTDRTGQPIAYNAPEPLAQGIIAAPEPLWQAIHGALR